MVVEWIDKGFFNVVDSFNPETGEKHTTANKCSINGVPTDILMETWESLVFELLYKKSKLAELKEEYTQKEFDIVFTSDIDFKKLYNSTQEKVRKQHAKKELQELNDSIVELELRIEFIKQYISLLKEVVKQND